MLHLQVFKRNTILVLLTRQFIKWSKKRRWFLEEQVLRVTMFYKRAMVQYVSHQEFQNKGRDNAR